MAKELGARRITVNVLAPGAIETDFAGGVVRDNKEVNKFLASQTALGRVGLPDDIGGAVASLLADDNLWITRQRIEAPGRTFLLNRKVRVTEPRPGFTRCKAVPARKAA